MAPLEFKGVVDGQPLVFDECPDYATLHLRVDDGSWLEVFFPAVDRKRYRIGQWLSLSGGEQLVDPGAYGLAGHVRYWPQTIRVVARPERGA